MTRRALLIGVAIVVCAACSGTPNSTDDEVISSVDALVGRWRALDSTETRVFLGNGTTWIEGVSGDGSSPPQQRGNYRLLSPGQLEIQLDGGSAQTWTVTFGHVAGKVLKLRDAGGQIRGYVDASTIPAYAPTTASDKE